MNKLRTSADTPVSASTSDQTKPTSEPPPSIPTAASCPEAVEAVPRIKVYQQGPEAKIKLDCKELELLKKALGIEDLDFLQAILTQLADVCSRDGSIDETRLNFMLSIIKGIKPKDQIEAMLAIQMASVHMAVVKNSRFLEHFDTVQEVDSVGGFFNKLTRTFTTRMEVLQRYRTGSEQKVTLQHVSVSGGQAFVGTVNQNSSGENKANKAMRPAITEARSAPMTIIEGNEQPVAVPAKLKPRQ